MSRRIWNLSTLAPLSHINRPTTKGTVHRVLVARLGNHGSSQATHFVEPMGHNTVCKDILFPIPLSISWCSQSSFITFTLMYSAGLSADGTTVLGKYYYT